VEIIATSFLKNVIFRSLSRTILLIAFPQYDTWSLDSTEGSKVQASGHKVQEIIFRPKKDEESYMKLGMESIG
jgi:hypothetical protein